MFKRYLTIFLAFLAGRAAADVYKTCSQIPFCANLRNNSVTENYAANLDQLDVSSQTVQIPLSNSQSNLVLTLVALESDRFRISIEEVDSARYKLQYSLVEEPSIIPITSVTQNGDGSVSVTIEKSRAVIYSSPFRVEFYHDDKLEVTVEGERLAVNSADSDQSFAFSVSFANSSALYGLSEHASGLALQHTADGSVDPYRNRNADTPVYPVDSTVALYGTIPVIYGHGSVTSGIFFHNAAEQWVDIDNENKSAYFMVQGGTLDLFILLGPTLKDVVRQYANLTGTAHLPQLPVLGYHQSRYSYMTQEDVKDVIANFDKYDFPVDTIWLDIDYTDGKRYFTWNPETFSDPIEMLNNLSSTNRHLVTILDPHIKVDLNYSVYKEALERNLFVNNSDGSVFEGDCWPGTSSYLDFYNPETRDFYAARYAYENFTSTPTLIGVWNDMNEPSVFDDSLEKTLPFDSVQYGGVKHGDIHNIYGHLQTMGTHQGLLQRDGGKKRPFILTRSHFAGTQRYAAIWTGDNGASWSFLRISYPMCLTANLLGQPFCGADIGGFVGDPDEELLCRWYQAAAWLPFMRGHSDTTAKRREPYLFSEETQENIRESIKMRYRHIPVWYTLFYEHTTKGDPIIRPLVYHYPDDENVFAIDDQVLLGSDILAKSISDASVTSTSVYLPGKEDYWYQITGDDLAYQGGKSVDIPVNLTFSPVFYRAGSIIPRKDNVNRSTTDMLNVPYTLHVLLDQSGHAEGAIYIDDFESFDYLNNKYIYLEYEYDHNEKVLSTRSTELSDADMNIEIDHLLVYSPPEDGEGHYTQTVHNLTMSGTPLRLSKTPVTLHL